MNQDIKNYKTNKAGIELIKRFEGFLPYVYLDQVGLPTIGYGHLCRERDFYLQGMTLDYIRKNYINDKSSIKLKTHITKIQAEALLVKDLQSAENSVKKLITHPININQFSALVSFTFNLGGAALQRSTLRRKINRGDTFESIQREFYRWVYAGGRKLPGLLRRRIAESQLYSTLL